jgi:hypothetical protein
MSKRRLGDVLTNPGQSLARLAPKGAVSPDIVFHFKVYKSKSVLLVRPLMGFSKPVINVKTLSVSR